MLRARARLGRRIAGSASSIPVPAATVSRLIALHEFGENLVALRAKREAVQRLRRRDDVEIISMFKAPLDPGFAGPGFDDYNRRLLAALKMDNWVRGISE